VLVHEGKHSLGATIRAAMTAGSSNAAAKDERATLVIERDLPGGVRAEAGGVDPISVDHRDDPGNGVDRSRE
jgi:hypothetical protein